MARFPGAIWKPITASKGRQALTVYNRMNFHIAVSEASSLHGYFNQPGIPDSHFYIRRDGTIEQYVDTSMRAFADLEGNDATISVETQGMGTGGWTSQQREALARLYVWSVRTHGIARKMATDSKIGESSHGLSWHRLGCDGNFPSLPSILAGRTQRGGGMHYSTSFGKVCPGSDQIVQIPGIFSRALVLLEDAPAPTPVPEEETMAFEPEDVWRGFELAEFQYESVNLGEQTPGERLNWLTQKAITNDRRMQEVTVVVREMRTVLDEIRALLQESSG